MHREQRRVDKNQSEIVSQLRELGASVKTLHFVGKGFPDLAVGYRGKNYLLEVKTKNGKLTDDEKEFIRNWNGTVNVIRTIDDFIELIRH